MICLCFIEIWPHEYRSKTKNLFYSMNLISAGWGSLMINNWNLSSDTAFNQLVSNGWISQRTLFRLSSVNKSYYQSVTLWRTFMMVTLYFHFRIGDDNWENHCLLHLYIKHSVTICTVMISMFMPTYYNDVIMNAMASQITSLTIVYFSVYSRRRSKKTSKLRVTGLCEGDSPVTGEFPAHRAG